VLHTTTQHLHNLCPRDSTCTAQQGSQAVGLGPHTLQHTRAVYDTSAAACAYHILEHHAAFMRKRQSTMECNHICNDTHGTFPRTKLELPLTTIDTFDSLQLITLKGNAASAERTNITQQGRRRQEAGLKPVLRTTEQGETGQHSVCWKQ
jgi:hypothetical protein